jgi:bifunctional non-homologous end joining protein LigD
MSTEQITLRFTQGSSDKVYKASLKESSPGFYLVNFAYGRRGKPLKTGTKTSAPVSYEIAKRAYDKLVTEKKSKGYTEDGSGKPFEGTVVAPDRTGYLPQLLNPIEAEDLSDVFRRFNGRVALQTKHDGERRIVICKDGQIQGSNRRGLAVDLHETIKKALERFLEYSTLWQVVFDCEDMGEHLVIFDILESNNENYAALPFKERAVILRNLSVLAMEAGIGDILIFDLPYYPPTALEAAMFIQGSDQMNEEGVVLRHASAHYEVGRPNSGGPCLKLKFYASATCMVGGVHPTKRSVSLMVLGRAVPVGVGNCTIPPNYPMPQEGDLVEVKYLYAYREGSLYQPQYKGVRSDKTDMDTIESLKYKD